MAFPEYGGSPALCPPMFAAPPAADPMWGFFTAVAGLDGEVDARELQRCLTESGFSSGYTPFSLDTCRIMIAMLDRDHSGKMGFSQFRELFAALNAWKQNFVTFDRDHSGTMERHEMDQAFNAMGYHISPQALNAIMTRYGRAGKIHFDDYVSCCIRLQTLTGNFRRRDVMSRGRVTFQYDEFILYTMSI